MQNAAFGILASLITAGATFGVVVTVAEQNDRQAAKMIVDAQKSSDYLSSVTTWMAVSQARPRGF